MSSEPQKCICFERAPTTGYTPDCPVHGIDANNEPQKPAVSEQAEARWRVQQPPNGMAVAAHAEPAHGVEIRNLAGMCELANALEAQVTQLQQQLEEAQKKAALAEEIRQKRRDSHTVFWWQDYFAEFDTRYDALTADTEEGAGE